MQIQFRQDGSLYVGWSKKYTRNGVVRERQQAVILPQLPLAEPSQVASGDQSGDQVAAARGRRSGQEAGRRSQEAESPEKGRTVTSVVSPWRTKSEENHW